jgi:outer membrane protein, heavy metal efflux system
VIRSQAAAALTRATLVSLVLLAASALAQPLEAFLARADASVGVVTAMLERDDAERAATRTEADPLALRPDLLQARQRAELAAAEATHALFQAYADVARAFAQVREAELQVALAQAGQDLAQRGVEIARLRFERGSVTELDVQGAETDLLEAERGLQAARDGAALARTNLAGVTGLAVDGTEPIDRARLAGLTVPDDATLEAAVDGVPNVMRLRHAVALASLGVELLDPSFAARAQIDQAETQRDQATAGLREARRGVSLQLRSLANGLHSAIEGDRIAQDAVRQAREREAIERRRLDAGLIAEIAFDQTVLQTMQAELQAVQAEHALVAAVLELQAGALLPMEGWHEF